MKEVTFITTLQVTEIVKMEEFDPECVVPDRGYENMVKNHLGLDDVKVLKSQIFILNDVKEVK